MCLSSGRGCTVIPSAPKVMMSFAVLIRSGLLPPRELRSVAILLMFTDNFVMALFVSAKILHPLYASEIGRLCIAILLHSISRIRRDNSKPTKNRYSYLFKKTRIVGIWNVVTRHAL